jgi:hypothetical protein
MNEAEAKKIVDKIVEQVFGYRNPLTMEQFMKKFAFDVKLPQPVTDAVDGTTTWAQSTNPVKFMKMENARGMEIAGAKAETDFLRPKQNLKTIEDILATWQEINFTTTERQNDSINIAQSDNIQRSENVFRSQDIRDSRNIVFTDGAGRCEFIAASQRSQASVFGIRIDDSGECTNCFNVSWCGRLTNCLFMHDCGDMQDSMFCTNLSGKRFCIANMQFEEAEYRRLRDIVVQWILTEGV